MSNYQRTEDWLKACGKEPNEENLSLQIACHLEEITEFLQCLSIETSGGDIDNGLITESSLMVGTVTAKIKMGICKAKIPYKLRHDALDALCDMEVTGNGIAYLAGFNKIDADQTVLDSNDAKLVDGKPVILPSGKIGKPEGWIAPDLSKFV